jgi:hypothetical protein
MLNVTIPREIDVKMHRFTDHFKGFEQVEAIRRLFGKDTEEVLNRLKVEFSSWRKGYMAVNEDDGHLMVSTYYLKHGDKRHIYLDIIHELNHVKQYQEGKELFDERFEYVDRPTEIEAYKSTVKEARRIGLTETEILDYLKTEWINEDDLCRLSKKLGLDPL